MSDRIQNTSFNVSKYFRPLEKWHCGGQSKGQPCTRGPDKYGRCCITVKQCQPYKDGHIWQCTRSSQMSNHCKLGPTTEGECGAQAVPCTPILNIRARRNKAALLSLIIVTAIALSALVFNVWQSTISSGPLSKHHASFGDTDCASCHKVASESKTTWLSQAFSPHSKSDTNNCISCHQLGGGIENPDVYNAHMLDEHTLNQLSRIAKQDSSFNLINSSPILMAARQLKGNQSQNQPPCSICHQEHNGSSVAITAVSNQQCVVCHSSTFEDFTTHPKFDDYPAARRTPIIFDHNSHFGKHFKDEKLTEFAPAACVSCHMPDSAGQKMQVKNFETSCSACHSNETTGEDRAAEKGIAMLSVPALDTETLFQRGIDLGNWPDQSDAEPTPLLYILLSVMNSDDTTLAKKLSQFRTVDLYDLSDASDEDLLAVADVAWEIKRLYLELQRTGPTKISQNLDTHSSFVTNGLWGQLSPNLIDLVVETAFPDLMSSVTQWNKSAAPEFTLKPRATPNRKDNAQPQDNSSNQLPEDDNWLANATEDADGIDSLDDDWLDTAATDSGNDILDDDILDDDILDDDILDDDILDDDILDDDILDDGSVDEDDWLADSANELSSEGDIELAELSHPIIDALSLEDRASGGGWYFEEYILRYRPSGHADPLIVAWINYLIDLPSNQSGRSMLSGFTSKDYPGACVKCHSIEESTDTENQTSIINWQGTRVMPSTFGFNRFTHQTHLGVIAKHENVDADRGCTSCHIRNTESDSAASYQQMDPSIFNGNFIDLDKDSCGQCHTKTTELQSCTLCHNYHIGERGVIGIKKTL